MFELLHNIARAKDLVDVNVAAGVARPKLARTFFFLWSVVVIFLTMTTVMLGVGYHKLRDSVVRQERNQGQIISALTERQRVSAERYTVLLNELRKQREEG